MSSSATLHMLALVDDAERPSLVAAAEQLSEALSAAGSAREIRLEFATSFDVLDVSDATTLVIASLLPDVSSDESLPSVEARWRAQLASLPVVPELAVFLCTVFRYVPREVSQPKTEQHAAIAERIRRLNLLAAELSHDTGIGIVDIDRVFAHLGAHGLKTGYRISGVVAAEVAAHTIVATLLSTGLDEAVAPEIQERALKFQGALSQIGGLLKRRLGRTR